MLSKTRTLFFLFILVTLLSTITSACSTQSKVHDLAMAPMDRMPAEVQSAPVSVQTAYQFNVANPGVMKDIPCYCGCGNVGHESNYACYVSSDDGQGNITFQVKPLLFSPASL